MDRIAQIVSTARYLPEQVVPNAELAARFAALGRPGTIERLAGKTGINQRFYAPKDWVTSDLALEASKEALKRAGRQPEDVDLVIVGTTSPDYIAPNTAVVLQHKLGAKNAGGDKCLADISRFFRTQAPQDRDQRPLRQHAFPIGFVHAAPFLACQIRHNPRAVTASTSAT